MAVSPLIYVIFAWLLFQKILFTPFNITSCNSILCHDVKVSYRCYVIQDHFWLKQINPKLVYRESTNSFGIVCPSVYHFVMIMVWNLINLSFLFMYVVILVIDFVLATLENYLVFRNHKESINWFTSPMIINKINPSFGHN